VKLFQVSSAQPLKKNTTHSGTHSAIYSNDETHDTVTKDTGADCHSPTEADINHRRSYTTKVSALPHTLTPQSKDVVGNSPTSQFETAQASAIQ
jgi:hypothetical protein